MERTKASEYKSIAEFTIDIFLLRNVKGLIRPDNLRQLRFRKLWPH